MWKCLRTPKNKLKYDILSDQQNITKDIYAYEVIYVDASSNLATSTYNKHMGVIWIRGVEEVNTLSVYILNLTDNYNVIDYTHVAWV